MKKKKKTIDKKDLKKKVPLGLKVISIAGFVFTALFIFTGIFSFILGVIYTINPNSVNLKELGFPEQFLTQMKDNFGADMIMLGIIFAIIAVLVYLVSKEILNRKNWARIVIIVFLVLSLISDISNLLTKKISLYFYFFITFFIKIIIIYYLIADKEIKKFFS